MPNIGNKSLIFGIFCCFLTGYLCLILSYNVSAITWLSLGDNNIEEYQYMAKRKNGDGSVRQLSCCYVF